MRALIVNADDWNLTAGVSRGVLEAHRHGVVTSTTVLVNLPPDEEALAELSGTPTLGVGLHLNLTWGRSLSPPEAVPSLLDGEGRFLRDPEVVAARAKPVEARQELEAQLEAFETFFGRRPTHLDSHHHLHRHPPLEEVVLDLALNAGLPLRSQEPAVRDRLRRLGVVTTDHFLGDVGAEPYWTVSRLLDTLAGLDDGVTELMCHPGRYDETLAWSRYGRQREAELAALADPEVRATVERLGIRLLHFGALGSLPG